jgi:hypothetical protein
LILRSLEMRRPARNIRWAVPRAGCKIVDNLAALVAELDRSFMPAIKAISGPAPDWYRRENFTGERTG